MRELGRNQTASAPEPVHAIALEPRFQDCEGERTRVAAASAVSVFATLAQEAKTLEGLKHSERHLELITDALPVLVSVIDKEHRYQFVSGAYEQWFNLKKEEILGKRLQDVLGREAYATISPHLTRALAGETVSYEAEVAYRKGGTRFIEATYVPRFDENGHVSGVVSLVSDISERKAFDRYRVAAAAQAEKLLWVTGAIAASVSREDVYEALVDQVAKAMDASTAALWLLDEEGKILHLARSVGYAAASREQLEHVPLDLMPSLPLTDCVRRNEAIFVPSRAVLLRSYPQLSALVTAGRTYRCATLPLVVHGRTLGALAVTLDDERDASESEREFLQIVARYAGQALERLRLLEAERQSRAQADAAAHRLAVLNRASRVFVDAGLDLRSRIRKIGNELATTLGGTVNLALIEPDGLLHLSCVRHQTPEAQEILEQMTPNTPLHVGEGVTGNIAATGESVLLNDIEPRDLVERAAPAYQALLQRFPVYALMGVPLRVRGRVIGTVTVARSQKGERYSTEDLHLLEELAERAALAIDNSRLYQETESARTRAEQLYRFAEAVMAADRLEVVLDAAHSAIETALGVRRSAILTFGDEERMRFRSWRNLSDEYRNAVDGHSPWSADEQSPFPILVSDVDQDPAMEPYLPVFRREGIRALAFVPLIIRGRLLGKFMLYYDAPHAFVSHELETAKAIAGYLSSVVTRFGAVAELQETIRHNELLAGVLAHDLRNPLGAMMTAAQLVLMRREGEAVTSDRDQKPLSRILSSGQRMKVMIEQLLDFTEARRGGGIDVVVGETNLADLCAQAASELELAHPDWKISQHVTGDPRGSWDSDRMLQVLSNLIGNAGQHGDRAQGITLRIDGSNARVVILEVHNGGSVPPDLLPYLFDPFRSTRHRRDQSRGLGLGLYIVREIVRAHGGNVTVTSSDASGTSFTVTLPRTRPPARPPH